MKKNIFLLFSIFVAIQNSLGAYRFAVYSDCHATSSTPPPVFIYITSQITSLNPPPNFVCFLGDAVQNAGGSDLKDWHDYMNTALNGIPLYVAVGNHDVANDDGQTPDYNLQVNYQNEFSDMPANAPSSDYTYLTYSFEYGTGDSRSLFIFLDAFFATSDLSTYFYGDYDGTQSDWYQQQLASSTAPHKFLLAHAPFINPVEGGFISPINIDPLINGRSVRQMWYNSGPCDIVFCGHQHIYSRWSLFSATSVMAPQIMMASAGGTPYDDFMPPPLHPYYGYGFVVVDVEGKNITVQSYGVTDNGDGTFSKKIIDTVRLSR